MTNHPNRSAYAKARRQIAAAGYSRAQIAEGLAYARSKGAQHDDVFTLAMSRILYTDEQLADGALFGKKE